MTEIQTHRSAPRRLRSRSRSPCHRSSSQGYSDRWDKQRSLMDTFSFSYLMSEKKQERSVQRFKGCFVHLKALLSLLYIYLITKRKDFSVITLKGKDSKDVSFTGCMQLTAEVCVCSPGQFLSSEQSPQSFAPSQIHDGA